MNHNILILGGARSGKSRYALHLGQQEDGEKKVYLATAEAKDAEMAARIEDHRHERGNDWQTIEEPLRLSETLQSLEGQADVVLIDCLTLWLNNLMMKTNSEGEITQAFDGLIETIAKAKMTIIAVSNEVGQGIVPADALTRRFRDLAGRLNQQWAAAAQTVYWMLAGIPQRIK